ncbi:hypothetical protein CRG98_015347 [Punica granatum]|uniref:Uncharacterized protein n=1 Tax=Punica granatum TaxID=22663 RepID=A0A2I0K6V0_PUNGR|nr:hypothetical protein CRG98_015347 [Punica granatum]
MSRNSLNRSRGDLVGSGKSKEPLGLTPREVAESPSWLPRAMISPGSLIGPTVTAEINRFSCRTMARSDPTPGSLSPRCLNLFIDHSKHTVYPVPLDPGDSTALHLRVIGKPEESKPSLGHLFFRQTRELFCLFQNVLPSLGIRGKSRGSVRESGDSVERLEGCSGAKDARSGKDGRAGGALEYSSVRVGASGAQECVRTSVWRAGVRVDGRLARGRAHGRVSGTRLCARRRVYCSPESTSFTRNEEINLK